MWSRYTALLKRRPLATNVTTALVVGFAGDMLAQACEKRLTSDDGAPNDAPEASSGSVAPSAPSAAAGKGAAGKRYDTERALKVALFQGLFSVGLTPYFRWLDNKFPTGHAAGISLVARLRVLAPKVLVNQSLAAPINNSSFYAWVIAWRHARGLAEPGATLFDDVKRKLVADLPRTTMNSFMVWGTVHSFNFLFLPPHTRVLFNSVGQVVWVCYLSIVGHRASVSTSETIDT